MRVFFKNPCKFKLNWENWAQKYWSFQICKQKSKAKKKEKCENKAWKFTKHQREKKNKKNLSAVWRAKWAFIKKLPTKGRDLDSDRGGVEAARELAAFSGLPTAFWLWLTALHCQYQAGTRRRAEWGWAAGITCLLMTYTKQLSTSCFFKKKCFTFLWSDTFLRSTYIQATELWKFYLISLHILFWNPYLYHTVISWLNLKCLAGSNILAKKKKKKKWSEPLYSVPIKKKEIRWYSCCQQIPQKGQKPTMIY